LLELVSEGLAEPEPAERAILLTRVLQSWSQPPAAP